MPGEAVRVFLDRTILPLLRDLAGSRRGAVLRLLIAEASRFPKLAEVYYRAVVEPGLPVVKKLIAKRSEPANSSTMHWRVSRNS